MFTPPTWQQVVAMAWEIVVCAVIAAVIAALFFTGPFGRQLIESLWSTP